MVYGAWSLTRDDVLLLKDHHRITVEVYILDSDRRILFNMTDRLLSGVVDIDIDADYSRKGKIALLDPAQQLTIDFQGSGYGQNMTKRLVHIIYRVTAMDRSRSYACPIFTGPVTKSKRDGVVVNLEFSGQEFLLSQGLLNTITYPAGWRQTEIIANMARNLAGIVEFNDTTPIGGWIGSSWSAEAGESAWARMKELADAGGFNIFFDGNGVLQMRSRTTAPISTILLDTTWLTEEPDFDIDTSKLRNVVRLEGATIPGTDAKLFYEAWPPAAHPFSPQSLARNGVLRVIPHIVSDSSMDNLIDIKNSAEVMLAWDLMAGESNSAVVPVIPFLEEYDVVTLSHPKLYANAPITKASIPLVGDAEMSLNFFSTTSVGRTRGGQASNTNYDRYRAAVKAAGIKRTKEPKFSFHAHPEPKKNKNDKKKNRGHWKDKK